MRPDARVMTRSAMGLAFVLVAIIFFAVTETIPKRLRRSRWKFRPHAAGARHGQPRDAADDWRAAER